MIRVNMFICIVKQDVLWLYDERVLQGIYGLIEMGLFGTAIKAFFTSIHITTDDSI